MFSGVDNKQGALATFTSAVELLLSSSGSAVVLTTLAVFVSTVPLATVSTRYVAKNTAVSPRPRLVMVQLEVPVSPVFGLVQVKVGPLNCANDSKVVLAGTSSVKVTGAASGPRLLT